MSCTEAPRLKILREASAEGLPLPTYQSADASGLDVCAAVDAPVTLAPGEIRLIPTGLRMAVPRGYEVQVRPRSGLALKHGILVVNSPGTIDADYRGTVGVILGNFGSRDFTVQRGDRIAQLVVQRVHQLPIEETDRLDDTARGDGGFGSTGVRS